MSCPWCRCSILVKHCPPGNTCGWWRCELPCGYLVSLGSGRAMNMRWPTLVEPRKPR